MSMKVEITSNEVKELSGKSGKTGNDYHMLIQTAFLHVPNSPYPERFEITLGRDQTKDDAYAPGMYEINLEESLNIFNGRLNLSPKLTPIKSELKTVNKQ